VRPDEGELLGFLHEERKRCGKANCRCTSGREEDLHGPYYYRRWRDEEGNQRREYVPEDEVEKMRARIENRRRRVERERAKRQRWRVIRCKPVLNRNPDRPTDQNGDLRVCGIACSQSFTSYPSICQFPPK
jgi:hypothetical protein